MKLVGGLNPSEKYEFVSWDYDNPNICKVIKFHGSKPPTRYESTIGPAYGGFRFVMVPP
jgi:hypothetical protein